MEIASKKSLTSDAIYYHILSIVIVIISSKLLIDDRKVAYGVDFETDFEHKVYLIGSIGLLIYSLTRPHIYFDDANFYIKKITKKKETIIPLRNITSIFKNPFGGRGSRMITIEFINKENEPSSVKFSSRYSTRLKDLIGKTQQQNPNVEIV
jgi:hypothetical protein